MLICPKCGAQYPDGSNFCEMCGSNLVPAPQGAPNQYQQGQNPQGMPNQYQQGQNRQGMPNQYQQGQNPQGMPNQYQQGQNPQQGKPKQPRQGRSNQNQKNSKPPSSDVSKRNILIGVIVLIVIVTAGICIYMLYRSNQADDPAATSVSASSSTASKSSSTKSDSTSSDSTKSDSVSSSATASTSEKATATPKATTTPETTRKPITESTEKKVTAADITASLVDQSSVNLAEFSKVTIVSSGETSSIVQEGHNNKAEVAVDGQEITSWQEGVAGDGIGEGIWFNMDRSYEIKYLSFKLGNWRDQKNYTENNRPSKLKITVGDFVTSIDFPNTKQEFYVALFQPYAASVVDIRIEAVYKGTDWDDTCIAEIGIYGK